MEIRSASMLVTKNGYCVKVVLPDGSDVCFFTDGEMNHRTWQLTQKKPGILLDRREFWRMRREWKLQEVSLTATQLAKAVVVAEKVIADPYHGFSYSWRRKYNIPTTEEFKRRNSTGQNYGVAIINSKVQRPTLGDNPALQALRQKFS
ncbi:MAG TPA: hypothetical protein PLQ20_00285 [Candidatus Paceibacterota bacterium]|nr:hypothetical protein [Candidatus Paceibacterota bacterium]